MRKASERKLGDLELQILNVLWEQGTSTVRQVLVALPVTPRPAYTTVLTMMRLMEEKGYLTRKEQGRAHVYTARLQEKRIKRGLLHDLIDNAFRGSSDALLVHLLENRDLSGEELARVRRLIVEKTGEKKP
jgi:BlaI family transcriptional regulator, penicillinase repressor